MSGCSRSGPSNNLHVSESTVGNGFSFRAPGLLSLNTKTFGRSTKTIHDCKLLVPIPKSWKTPLFFFFFVCLKTQDESSRKDCLMFHHDKDDRFLGVKLTVTREMRSPRVGTDG